MNIASKQQNPIFHDINLDKLEGDPRLKTFCALPWMHLFVSEMGEHYPCCVSTETPYKNTDELGEPFHINDPDALHKAWNSSYMRDIRLKMLRGERPQPCMACFRLEDMGIESTRYWSNFKFADMAQKPVQLTRSDGTSELTLYSFDIRLGNQCNLRCRMCSPMASKGLVEDFKQLGMSEQDANRYLACDWFEQPEFWELFLRHSRNIRALHFAGGEPFLIKQHFSFLKELVTSDLAQHITLSYNTNLTLLPQELLELWKNFSQIIIIVSIDGLSDVNRYIRFPSNWEQIQKNIRFIHDNMTEYRIKDFAFNITVQVYNIFTVTDVIDFLLDQYPNAAVPTLVPLVFPPELSMQVLSASVKQELTSKLNTYLQNHIHDFRKIKKNDIDQANRLIDNIDGIVKFLNAKDESHLLPDLIRRTQIADEIRNLYCSDCVPELAAIFANYRDANRVESKSA